MTRKEKLIARFRSRPKDFTFDEAVTLLSYFGYQLSNKGKPSGSRVEFVEDDGPCDRVSQAASRKCTKAICNGSNKRSIGKQGLI